MNTEIDVLVLHIRLYVDGILLFLGGDRLLVIGVSLDLSQRVRLGREVESLWPTYDPFVYYVRIVQESLAIACRLI